MLLSKMAHLMSIIAGIGGAGALVGAWIAGEGEKAGPFSGASKPTCSTTPTSWS